MDTQSHYCLLATCTIGMQRVETVETEMVTVISEPALSQIDWHDYLHGLPFETYLHARTLIQEVWHVAIFGSPHLSITIRMQIYESIVMPNEINNEAYRLLQQLRKH